MAPQSIDDRLAEIEKQVEQIHAAIVGDIHGRSGLVQRMADLDSRVARLESAQGWVKTLLGGAAAAIISAWALVWGGPHGK